jgi:NAD(P)-dependent dehydrogenase (short-subunit alcohol dehydrogenase family)
MECCAGWKVKKDIIGAAIMPIRTALITGCANGIGRAIALRLVQDGFQVAINDLASQESNLKKLQHEIELKGMGTELKVDLY